jgi:hypothetical protein
VISDHTHRARVNGLGSVFEVQYEERRDRDTMLASERSTGALIIALECPDHIVDLVPKTTSSEHVFGLRALLARVAVRQAFFDHGDLQRGFSDQQDDESFSPTSVGFAKRGAHVAASTASESHAVYP